MISKKNICVIGLGYIGLPTASLLATKGYDVLGVDVSESIVSTINSGKVHIVEPDLDILVKSAVNSGKLKASLQPKQADVFIIAVPTPFKEGHQPDLAYVEQATRLISPYVKKGNLIILESTSPTGTTDETVAKILKAEGHNIEKDIFVAHCPERVLPGQILHELVANDRIVGGINKESTKQAASFYREFVKGDILETDARTAEMAKLTENSFRDVNIAFANEISIICDEHSINPWELINLANRHPRVNILQPGPGVGGHCIAVDPWFIISKSPDTSKLIRAAREVNDYKTDWVIQKVIEKASRFKNPLIACLGLAFKADVDDLRESPALRIALQLKQENIGEIIACEPNIESHKEIDLFSLEDAIKKADILLLLVDHKPFIKLSSADLKEKIIIDTRGVIK
ncbi:MAG: UDP-N-acetyl-D-mannosaminuronic acid dehydrogenase [Francisellaceae bacterium]|jgi:UDP-N-acetyl-D-mannosaminuronic acid dehydrogenase